MTENPQHDAPQQESQPSAGTQNTEHMIPKSRLDEVLGERNELRERLAALESAQQQQQTKELEEREQFRELYEQAQQQLAQMETVQQQASRFQEALATTNAARLDRLPDNLRALAPSYDDPIQMSEWLDRASAAAPMKPTPPSLDGGSGDGGSSARPGLPANVQGVADLARSMGYEVNDDRIAQYARNPQRPTNTGE